MKDTIYALSTANGKSAIAVFRISGINCKKIINKFTGLKKIKLNTPSVTRIYKDSSKKQELDEIVLTFQKGPKSYTGEDLIELSVHGSISVIDSVTKTLSRSKLCRIADPGEFTRRAFENNKIDLTQVEAVSDLIDAETELQRSQALKQLKYLTVFQHIH